MTATRGGGGGNNNRKVKLVKRQKCDFAPKAFTFCISNVSRKRNQKKKEKLITNERSKDTDKTGATR